MKNGALKRHLGLFGLSFFGIGTIIGAGIYSVVGIAYGHAGFQLWLSFILSSIAAMLTGLSYCELSTMFPSAGAEYIYLKAAFPGKRFVSFILAVVLLLAGTATAATVAVSFSGYFHYLFGGNEIFYSILVLSVSSLINALGIESSNKANVLFTLIEIAGLILIIYFGFSHGSSLPDLEFKLTKGVWTATSLIFFVYLGFEDIANLAEEARNPEKTIPKAIFLSLTFTSVLYIAFSFALTMLADPGTLAKSEFPLVEVLRAQSVVTRKILGAIALFSTGNTVLITLLVGSRMLYSVSNNGDLPKIFSRVHHKTNAPVLATLVTLFISILFLFAGNLEVLAGVSSLAALLGFIMTHIAVLRLKKIKKNITRPFSVPEIFPWMGMLLSIAMCLQFNRQTYLITFTIAAAGTAAYFLIKARRRHYSSLQ